jgi:AcrR family transcriptional regulator
MKSSFKQNLEADGPDAKTGFQSPPRDRVLEVACELFAEAGFHGTHLREICKRAGTNVAGVCYHFQSKEGLYRAVLMEAGRRLSDRDENLAAACAHLPPEERLPKVTHSLLQKLNARRAWTVKLLARELVDPACGAHTYVASGLERDFVLLQAVLRDLLGMDATNETIRLHALSLIGESVLYCLAGNNPHHPLAQLAVGLPTRTRFARFLMERSLGTSESEDRGPELSRDDQALQTDLPGNDKKSATQPKFSNLNHTTETENLPQTGSQHL